MTQPARQTARRMDRRLLVLAPTGRDAQLATEVLGGHGFVAERCVTAEDLCAEIRRGAGAAIVAGEALNPVARRTLLDCLRAQPFWSELPVIVLARRGEDLGALHASFECNMTILERPVQIDTLVAASQAALRARHRQYEVRDLVEQLRETDRRKDEFLAMLGHELRNPLGVIRTALELLRDCDTESVPRQVVRIDHQISHLSRMVDDLLDLSRVSRGRITLQRQPCELGQLAAGALDATAAATRGRPVVFERAPEPLWVDADPVRLEQVVTNLVQNALKYSGPETPITVVVEREHGWARLRVRDRGIGIEPKELGRIFDTFHQLPTSLARSGGGLGLGLSLVRHLVRLHGGRVEARSEGLGKGSEFVVRIPLLSDDRVPLEAPEPLFAPAAGTPEVEVGDDGGGAVAATPGDAAEPRTPRILVVEDLDDARDALAELLTLYGYEVDVAGDGLTALDLAALHPPQVALLDIGLPGIDGYELARRLRDRLGRAVTIVAMTGYGQAEDRRRSREAGFDQHLVKPVDPARLMQILRSPVAGGDLRDRPFRGVVGH